MKAIVRDIYGQPEVLRLDDIDRPSPAAGEVLLRVHASSVSIGDWFWLTGTPRVMRMVTGLRRPKDKVLGRDIAGVVEEIGEGVTDHVVGDEVYGEIDGGAYAEYAVAPADMITRKPANLSFDQAAAVPLAGVTALQGLRDKGKIREGQHVLINGASGAVGTFAVQIAKAMGTEVTGVCSGRHAELVRSIGADHIVDYETTDFTAGTERYDLIFDLAGSHGIREYRRVLTPDGIYVASTSNISVLLRAGIMGMFSGGQVVVFAAKESRADLETMRDLVESGAVRPVIERNYALEDTADAFRAQGAGHAQGRKVITVAAAAR